MTKIKSKYTSKYFEKGLNCLEFGNETCKFWSTNLMMKYFIFIRGLWPFSLSKGNKMMKTLKYNNQDVAIATL